MRRHNVLVSSTRPHDNVLKVRPPIALGEGHVPTFADALRVALEELPSSG
ncbi:hypothetical protein ACQP04_35515 [Pseudonocardia halophobica]